MIKYKMFLPSAYIVASVAGNRSHFPNFSARYRKMLENPCVHGVDHTIFLSMSQPLNEKQVDLLRYLIRQSGPVSSADLDGRIIRALKSRECITEHNGHVTVTDAGRNFLQSAVAPRVRKRRVAAQQTATHARAKAVQRAIQILELALPRDAEVAVGSIFASADDVVDGFRRYARALEKKKA